MSFNYPVKPTKEQQQYYFDFFTNLKNVLPCKYCRDNYSLNLQKYPITSKVLKNRESFSKWLYNIHELVKIIHNSIANSHHFFSNPTPIKNPYNNIVLNKSTLYNIYFFIQTNTTLNPELFYYFFKTNFHLNQFVKKYQYLLRNFSIKNYLNNSNKNVSYNNIQCMIDEYNSLIKYRQHQIIIDATFPKDLLINIMKPYLELFIKAQYSLLYIERVHCKNLLKKKLYSLSKYNPLFGRKIYKKNLELLHLDNNTTTKNFEYNSKHNSFYESEITKEKNEFMENHASNLIEEYDANDSDNETDNDSDSDSDNENEISHLDIIVHRV
jgi:hypothetical protein